MFSLSSLERVLEFLVKVGRLRNCRFSGRLYLNFSNLTSLESWISSLSAREWTHSKHSSSVLLLPSICLTTLPRILYLTVILLTKCSCFLSYSSDRASILTPSASCSIIFAMLCPIVSSLHSMLSLMDLR